jgi:hypothetical protein
VGSSHENGCGKELSEDETPAERRLGTQLGAAERACVRLAASAAMAQDAADKAAVRRIWGADADGSE